jgi:hypothetical protein
VTYTLIMLKLIEIENWYLKLYYVIVYILLPGPESNVVGLHLSC